MPNLQDRLPFNVPGRFYVDSSCIDCDTCRSHAPHFFRRNEEEGMSYVFAQPQTLEEIELCEEALIACPTESIGQDG